VYERDPAANTDRDIDLSAMQLPRYALPAGFTPFVFADRMVRWPEHPGGTLQPDVVRARIRVYRDDIPQGRAWTWQVVAARGEGPEIRFPTLPTDTFDFNPTEGDVVSLEELTNVHLPGGYDAVRAHGFARFLDFITAGTGRMVVQTLWSEPL
jgi:hypothetical protein